MSLDQAELWSGRETQQSDEELVQQALMAGRLALDNGSVKGDLPTKEQILATLTEIINPAAALAIFDVRARVHAAPNNVLAVVRLQATAFDFYLQAVGRTVQRVLHGNAAEPVFEGVGEPLRDAFHEFCETYESGTTAQFVLTAVLNERQTQGRLETERIA